MPAPNDSLDRLFPSEPTYAAHWAPIYLEPMQGSGERLTVAIVAFDDHGNADVTPVIADKTLRCMYGDRADQFAHLVNVLTHSLREYLSAGGHMEGWRSPLHGLAHVGIVRDALGQSLEDIMHSGAQLTASLSEAVTADALVSPEDETSPADIVDEWIREIRDRTIRQRKEFGPHFMRKVVVREGAPSTRFGYLGRRLAAQFGHLNPGKGLTTNRNRAKAYLTDLQMLRDKHDAGGMFEERTHYEMMLYVPPRHTPAYSHKQLDDAHGALQELEAFGKKHELCVVQMQDSATAVQRILQAEAG